MNIAAFAEKIAHQRLIGRGHFIDVSTGTRLSAAAMPSGLSPVGDSVVWVPDDAMPEYSEIAESRTVTCYLDPYKFGAV